MQTLKGIWDFFQYQILGMKWLDNLIGGMLSAMGLDTATRLAGSVEFFLYDVIKITILLCLLIFFISYIQSYFPPERSKKILGRFHGIWANCIAALLGTVTPFCSCSSIPLFIGFTSAGLPVGVTFSFLISSPMVDLGSLLLLMSIFGARVAVIYVVVGLVIAVIGGTIIEKLHMEKHVESFILTAGSVNIESPDLTKKDRLVYAREQMVATFTKVFPYILIGVGIGAVIHNWIPDEWVALVLGSKNPFGVVLATLVGVPMYADIFGTIPIAEALLFKGANLGTILSFMMAVTTLSLPSMIMLRKAVKPKLLALFIAICTVGIIAVGYFFNAIQGFIIQENDEQKPPGAAIPQVLYTLTVSEEKSMAKTWYPVIDYSACTACGTCVSMCSHGVYDAAKAPSPLVMHPEGCMDHCHGCGSRCPVGAITYVGDDTGWTPPNGAPETTEGCCACGCEEPSEKKVTVDYLYLDLLTCDRCIGTDRVLDEVMAVLTPALRLAGFTVETRQTEMATAEIAAEHRFLSSPTIRVNGRDICASVAETSCGCCGDISGTAVDCRVFAYQGETYEIPPAEMLAEAILKAVFAPAENGCDCGGYTLPENLKGFFKGKEKKTGRTCGCC